jgi:type VI secretion system protein
MVRLARWAACGVLMLAAGCSWFGPTKTVLRGVTVVAQDGANNATATAVDLVFVYDASAVALLPPTGPAWFAHRAALLPSLGPKVEAVSVQLPPNQQAKPVPMPARYKKALLVYCYVNFVAPAGQGMADLTQYKRVVITLGPNVITYDGTQ